MFTIEFCRLSDSAILPSKHYPTDAGIDLFANLDNDYILPSFESVLVPTGFSVDLKLDYPMAEGFLLEAQIRSKSGLALNNSLIVLNSPGTIDQDYNGELKVILYNAGYKTQIIKKNQKVAQLVINLIPIVKIKEVTTKFFESDSYVRGINGFGSTGLI